MALSVLLHLLALLCLISRQLSCLSMTFPGQADQVTRPLPGMTTTVLSTRHYSGYLHSLNGTHHLFYWFFESSSSRPSKDPLVLWLNGGPGGSSLNGALLGNGPLYMQANGSLTLNRHSWNSMANMLYIESPAGVGFSYKAGNESADSTDDYETALVNFGALRSFYRKFPQFESSDFYLTGQSYAGIYLPTLADLIIDHHFPPNFKGLSLGNPGLSHHFTDHSRFQLLHDLSWIDTESLSTFMDRCNCTNRSLLNCNLSHEFPPYLVRPESCYATYYALEALLVSAPFSLYNYKEFCKTNKTDLHICESAPEMALVDWLNQKDVQAVLHAVKPPRRNWSSLNRAILQQYRQTVASVEKQMQKILEKKIKVLLYYGSLDVAVPVISGQWFINSLNLTRVNKEPIHWFYEHQLHAFAHIYAEGPLALVNITNAGHVVVREKPEFTKHMLEKFLDSSLFTVEQ